MTPVTLECGGKCPVYVDGSADLDVTARRICWGRYVNAGQTCVAPDYILCTKETQEKLLPFLKKALQQFYGDNPKNSDSYGRIIQKRHHQRIVGLIDQAKVVIGGEYDEDNLYIAPTVMFNATRDDKIMQEETFGPILPIVTVSNRDEAIDYVNNGSKPLALYVFTKNKKDYEEFKLKTSSGSIAKNEVLIQIGFDCAPFGGVGDSGVGSYHGKFSFDTFSHSRTTLEASFTGDALLATRYPPYTEKNRKILEFSTQDFGLETVFKILFNPYVVLSLAVALGYYLKSFMQ